MLIAAIIHSNQASRAGALQPFAIDIALPLLLERHDGNPAIDAGRKAVSFAGLISLTLRRAW